MLFGVELCCDDVALGEGVVAPEEGVVFAVEVYSCLNIITRQRLREKRLHLPPWCFVRDQWLEIEY